MDWSARPMSWHVWGADDLGDVFTEEEPPMEAALWLLVVFAGLPILLKMLSMAGNRSCKACKSQVRREAKVCPACGADPKRGVPAGWQQAQQQPVPQPYPAGYETPHPTWTQPPRR